MNAHRSTASRLREQINDLYRIEIRKLRDRCRAGEFPVSELAQRVVELRKRYLLLSIPIVGQVTQSRLPTRMSLIASPPRGARSATRIAAADATTYTIPMIASWGTRPFSLVRVSEKIAAPSVVKPSE